MISEEILAVNPDDLHLELRNHWRNLVLLFEFFIPLVIALSIAFLFLFLLSI
jgi:hypothetical protein